MRTKGSYIGICVWSVKYCSLLPTISFSDGLCGVIQLKSHLCSRFPHLWRMSCHSRRVSFTPERFEHHEKMATSKNHSEVKKERGKKERHTQNNLEMLQELHQSWLWVQANQVAAQNQQGDKGTGAFPRCPTPCMAAKPGWWPCWWQPDSGRWRASLQNYLLDSYQ